MLIRETKRAVDALGLTGQSVLVAASAGLDSNALVHALLEITREKCLKVSLGHVNHGLRGDESEADQQAVFELADRLEVPAFSRRVEPEQLRVGRSSRERPTLQEAARTLRYRALREMAVEAGCRHIATAHNMNDQAETVLLRVFRGSGPDGLGGIPERSSDGVVVRPLLRVSRTEIEAYAAERGFSWREDRSNRSVAYARNRLRLRWLPGLAGDFNEQLLMAVGNLAEAQRRDSEWIGMLVEREAAARFTLEGGWLRTRAEGWDTLPEALARRLARWGLRRCGGERDATRVHLERMLGFLRTARPGTRLELPGGTRLERDRNGFRLGPIEPAGRGGCR
ncbi:MAG: tRNA lysidine(34) synthetase TilS [Myxococcales bacterium]|nr:tRNA lysidine(34) synthetase TilS [Myxococcales bacterium]